MESTDVGLAKAQNWHAAPSSCTISMQEHMYCYTEGPLDHTLLAVLAGPNDRDGELFLDFIQRWHRCSPTAHCPLKDQRPKNHGSNAWGSPQWKPRKMYHSWRFFSSYTGLVFQMTVMCRCDTCTLVKKAPQTPQEPSRYVPVGVPLNWLVTRHFCSPSIKHRGNWNILLVTYHYIKCMEICAEPYLTAINYVKVILNEVFTRFG